MKLPASNWTRPHELPLRPSGEVVEEVEEQVVLLERVEERVEDGEGGGGGGGAVRTHAGWVCGHRRRRAAASRATWLPTASALSSSWGPVVTAHVRGVCAARRPAARRPLARGARGGAALAIARAHRAARARSAMDGATGRRRHWTSRAYRGPPVCVGRGRWQVALVQDAGLAREGRRRRAGGAEGGGAGRGGVCDGGDAPSDGWMVYVGTEAAEALASSFDARMARAPLQSSLWRLCDDQLMEAHGHASRAVGR